MSASWRATPISRHSGPAAAPGTKRSTRYDPYAPLGSSSPHPSARVDRTARRGPPQRARHMPPYVFAAHGNMQCVGVASAELACGPQCVAWDRGTHGNSMGSRVGSAQRTRDSKSVPRGILPRAAAFLRVRRGGVCSRCSTRTEALQGVESARPLHCARDGSRRLDSQAKQQATGALVVPAVLACTHQILQEHVVHGAERVAPTPSRLVCVRARTA